MPLTVSGSRAAHKIGDIDEKLVCVYIQRKSPIPNFETIAGGLMLERLEFGSVRIVAKPCERIPDKSLIFGGKPPKLFFDAFVCAECPKHE